MFLMLGVGERLTVNF